MGDWLWGFLFLQIKCDSGEGLFKVCGDGLAGRLQDLVGMEQLREIQQAVGNVAEDGRSLEQGGGSTRRKR